MRAVDEVIGMTDRMSTTCPDCLRATRNILKRPPVLPSMKEMTSSMVNYFSEICGKSKSFNELKTIKASITVTHTIGGKTTEKKAQITVQDGKSQPIS